jgi:hypothetical protein
MIKLEQMSREELIEVIKIKDEIIKELREEIEAYRVLVEDLQTRLGIRDYPISGNGD